jgi:hypothetical protein
MNTRHEALQLFKALCLIVVLLTGVNAKAGLFGFGGDSWQEEVLLHDGSKIVVTRSQTYGGRHEIGQPLPIKEHTITFTLPNLDKRVTWTSEYGEDIGRANFYLLAVHALNGVPYIVTEPHLCLSYNKWGRPNPPYVVFKYDGQAWQRIPLADMPSEFKTINVALDIMGHDVENLVALGLVQSDKIRELNRHAKIPEHRAILREPLKPGSIGSTNCEQRVFYKGHWLVPNDPVARKFIDQQEK